MTTLVGGYDAFEALFDLGGYRLAGLLADALKLLGEQGRDTRRDGHEFLIFWKRWTAHNCLTETLTD